MRIDIITVLPELLTGPLDQSIIKRAQQKGLAEIHIHNLRDWSTDLRHRRVDDYAFGGTAGMVMQCEPIDRCISDLSSQRHYDEVIFVTPDGETFNQHIANDLSMKENLIILCGHYKGIDYRIREHLITPGAIGDEQSALSDSFQDDLLAPPVYTRPADYKGWKVPDILLSGHERKIREWEHEQALERTRRLRPDLLKEE